MSTDGKVTIWTTTQASFGARDTVAELLDLPRSDIRVIPMEVGGAFGGKHYTYVEPVAVLLSRKAGRPVKVTLNRAEVLQGTGPTPGSVIRLKMGATHDGRLVAAASWSAYEAGAYPGSAVWASCLTGFSLYRIPHFRLEGFDVVLNKPRVAAYRAPGATQIAFAVEQVMDQLAEALGMDPLAFRLLNAAREGDCRTDGEPFGRIGVVELIETAMAHPAWTDPVPAGPSRGRGVAMGYWPNWGGTSGAQLTLQPDGTVNLTTGSVDLTGTRTSMAQIVAEELGIAPHQVNSMVGDTETALFADGTGGSRTTFATGIAVSNGAKALLAELRRRAARLLNLPEEALSFAGGRFTAAAAPSRSLSIAEVAAKQYETGGPIAVAGVADSVPWAPAFALHIADVAVDPETGKVSILRYTAFQDVGRAIHPTAVEGQMQGGAVQGIGWALSEGYAWEGGSMRNPTFLDYRMPVALDVPPIDCVIVEVPAPNHPYGVRGVGEAPIVPRPAPWPTPFTGPRGGA